MTLLPEARQVNVHVDTEISINGMEFFLQSVAVHARNHWFMLCRLELADGSSAWAMYDDSTVVMLDNGAELPAYVHTCARFMLYRPRIEPALIKRRMRTKSSLGQQAGPTPVIGADPSQLSAAELSDHSDAASVGTIDGPLTEAEAREFEAVLGFEENELAEATLSKMPFPELPAASSVAAAPAASAG